MSISIEGYEIVSLVATSGMGKVYKAKKINLDRTVAIKVMHPHMARDASFVARFEREARAAAQIRHENVVNVEDFGKVDGLPFLVMEFVDGWDLDVLMEKIGTIPLELCCMILVDACTGLERIHQKEVVHRDLKPGNIMISKTGIAKITDFGLAKPMQGQGTDLTQVGTRLGTPAYMSPEQATSGAKETILSDVFSMGSVAYELLCGKPAFRGNDPMSLMNTVVHDEATPLRQVDPAIPSELEALVGRMMMKDPSKRPQGISEVIHALEDFMRSKGVHIDRRYMAQFAKDPEAVMRDPGRSSVKFSPPPAADLDPDPEPEPIDFDAPPQAPEPQPPGGAHDGKTMIRRPGSTPAPPASTEPTPPVATPTAPPRRPVAGGEGTVLFKPGEMPLDPALQKDIDIKGTGGKAALKRWVAMGAAVVVIALTVLVVLSLIRGKGGEVVDEAPTELAFLNLAPEYRIPVGHRFQMTIQAEDPTGAPLQYILGNPPPGAVVDSRSGIFSWKPESGYAGSHAFQFRVSNGQEIHSRDVTFVVSEEMAREMEDIPVHDVVPPRSRETSEIEDESSSEGGVGEGEAKEPEDKPPVETTPPVPVQPTGTMVIISNQIIEVVVDGQKWRSGADSYKGDLPVGSYDVVISVLEGFGVHRESVDIQEDQKAFIFPTFNLGMITLTEDVPGAVFYVDNHLIGPAVGITNMPITEGNHKFELRHRDRLVGSWSGNIREGREKKFKPKIDDEEFRATLDW